ncbi:hypothetical protein TKK_0010906 [Trichogramma kaykai]
MFIPLFLGEHLQLLLSRHHPTPGIATRAWLLCAEQQQQFESGSLRELIECEVYDGLCHVDKCPVTLGTNRRSAGHIDPGQTRLRLFGEYKAILSWRDPSLPADSPNKWRLNAPHFGDCSLYEADPRRLKYLRPLTFVVFENCDYLLIETYRMERRKQTVARASIVYHDFKILGLQKYVIIDGNYEKQTNEIDPYERVTYSTSNNRISPRSPSATANIDSTATSGIVASMMLFYF